MTPAETAAVLAKAAAYDRRTVGRADVAAWHEALADVDMPDALAAVTAHYRDSTDWLQPAHIRQRVRDARRARQGRDRAAAPLALPSRFETDAERDARVARGVRACRDSIVASRRRRPPSDPVPNQEDPHPDQPQHAQEQP